MLLLLFLSLALANKYVTFLINDQKKILPNSTSICMTYDECYSIYNDADAYMILMVPLLNDQCGFNDETYIDEFYYPVLLDENFQEIPNTDCLLRNFFSIAFNYLCYGYNTFENASWMGLYL